MGIGDAIGAVGIGATRACEDIAIGGQRPVFLDGIDISSGGWDIVNDPDIERGSIRIAIGISDGDGEIGRASCRERVYSGV